MSDKPAFPKAIWLKEDRRPAVKAVKSGIKQLQRIAKSMGIKIGLYGLGPTEVLLGAIRIPPEKRKQGLGSTWMRLLCVWADLMGLTVVLHPSVSFGATSRARLVRFYKRFGFIENKGKKRDFTITEDMYRRPDGEWGQWSCE